MRTSEFKKKQRRNYCVQLLNNTKRNFYGNINISKITDNRKFWKNIKCHFPSNKTIPAFNYTTATQLDVLDRINDIDVREATCQRNIPTKTFKQNTDLYLDIITNMFNNSIAECNFPDLADITPAFKKGDVTDKSSYRPISLLPCVSKPFEKLYSVQIKVHMEQYFSKYLCGFRKGLSTQYCLLIRMQKIRNSLDNKLKCGLLLTYLKHLTA